MAGPAITSTRASATPRPPSNTRPATLNVPAGRTITRFVLPTPDNAARISVSPQSCAVASPTGDTETIEPFALFQRDLGRRVALTTVRRVRGRPELFGPARDNGGWSSNLETDHRAR